MLFLYLWVSMEQVDRSSARETPKKRRSSGTRKSQYDVRSVDEITEDDLENIAYRSKDKIWDKENVSDPPPPHRCRCPGFGRLVNRVGDVSFRAARATSADRRLWTLRPFVAAGSASGPKVSSVGPA